MKITITNWKAYQKNTLQGFLDMAIDDIGLHIEGVAYFKNGDNKKWLTLPTKQYQADGKTRYQPFLTFPKTDDYWRFCNACWDAIEVWKAARTANN